MTKGKGGGQTEPVLARNQVAVAVIVTCPRWLAVHGVVGAAVALDEASIVCHLARHHETNQEPDEGSIDKPAAHTRRFLFAVGAFSSNAPRYTADPFSPRREIRHVVCFLFWDPLTLFCEVVCPPKYKSYRRCVFHLVRRQLGWGVSS